MTKLLKELERLHIRTINHLSSHQLSSYRSFSNQLLGMGMVHIKWLPFIIHSGLSHVAIRIFNPQF